MAKERVRMLPRPPLQKFERDWLREEVNRRRRMTVGLKGEKPHGNWRPSPTALESIQEDGIRALDLTLQNVKAVQ